MTIENRKIESSDLLEYSTYAKERISIRNKESNFNFGLRIFLHLIVINFSPEFIFSILLKVPISSTMPVNNFYSP